MSKQSIETDNGGTVFVPSYRKCPRCHNGMRPEVLYAHFYEKTMQQEAVIVLYQCTVCEDMFFCTYLVDDLNESYREIELFPIIEKAKQFESSIEDLSPNFCKIYNEALIAEQKGLKEICGIGYRKALEFLIKDYLIKNNPSKQEEIEKGHLGKCIKEFIEDPNIKTLAEKTAWLGNDETHFLRTYDETDTVEKMKKFINAMLYFIESRLAIAEAELLQPKSRKKS